MDSSNYQEYKKMEMRAYEEFIRRAVKINAPFMLKGSYVTRQYFSNLESRIPGDLDWVYLEKITEETDARKIFSDWVTEITEIQSNNNLVFNSFKKNDFWRRIDYAMSDDFPTVNTDLICYVDDYELEFTLDISFNLAIEQPPIPLTYKPFEGESFIIPYTVPLSLQVSWKIHQTLVRPRFKDLFDLIYLLKNPLFDENTLKMSFQALINECKKDKVDLKKVKYFLNYEFDKLFSAKKINHTWNFWRFNILKDVNDIYMYENCYEITDPIFLPSLLSDFFDQLKESLENKGFTNELLKDLK